jgi:hypothetical protein
MNPMAGRYFNNPGFAAAFSNLAGIFAPPGPDEMLGYEQLRGERFANDSLQSLYTNVDGFAPEALDRRASLLGIYNPTQGFEARNMGDATQRYGIDTQAATSRGNNAADNDARLRLGAFDARTNPTGAQGISDADIAATLGIEVPGFGAMGPVAPSETQVLGANLQNQLGDIPGLAEALAADGIGTSNVVTPEGPRMAPTGLSALGGAEPFINPGSEAAPKPMVFVGQDGTQIPGMFQSGQYMTADGQPIPPGFVPMNLAQPQGSNADLGVTNSNVTDFNRVQSTVTTSNLLIDELETLIASQVGAAGLPGTIKMIAQDLLQVGRELGASFGGDPDAVITPDMLGAVLDSGEGYDPTFRQIRTGLLQLAYLNAQRDNPRGEVSRFALERQIEALGQGRFGNDESVLGSLGMARSANQRALAGAEALVGRNPQAPAAPPGTAAAPAPGAPARIRYDANGNRIE